MPDLKNSGRLATENRASQAVFKNDLNRVFGWYTVGFVVFVLLLALLERLGWTPVRGPYCCCPFPPPPLTAVAFFLAATSDSTRSILYGNASGASAMQDGLLSVSSISQMTGIPRETVRRKCVELAEKGTITREGSRLYRCVIPDDMTADLAAKIDSIIQLNDRLTKH